MKKKLIIKKSLAVFLIINFLLYYLLNTDVGGPAYQQDEIGYLVNAAFFGGFVIDGYSSYHIGYSLLLAPIYYITGDTNIIWSGVKLINVLLWSGSYYLANKLLFEIYGVSDAKVRIFALSISAIYPTWIAISGYAFSQSLFVFVFVASVICLFKWKPDKPLTILSHSAAVSYLFIIHPTALAIVLSSLVCISIISFRAGRGYHGLMLHFVILMGVVIGYKIVVQPWMMVSMTPDGYDPRSHYPNLNNILSAISFAKFWQDWILASLGQISYLLICSVGVIYLGIKNKIKNVIFYLKSKNNLMGIERAAVDIYVLMSLFGIIAITSLSFASQYDGPGTLDEWFYGRYVEGVIMPLLVLGAASSIGLKFGKLNLLGILTPILIVAVGLLIDGQIDREMPLNLVNVQAFWPNALFLNQSIVVWFSVGALVLLFNECYKFKYLMYISVVFFVVTTIENINWHKNILNNYSKPSNLIQLVRDNYEVGACVGFDDRLPSNANSQVSERIRLYSFYLFNYDFKRMNVNYWMSNCDGPYFTYQSIEPSISEEYNLIAYESNTGLRLYAKSNKLLMKVSSNKKFYNSIIMDEDGKINCINPGKCILQNASGMMYNTKITDANGEYLESKGVEGYLFYGPYQKLHKGKYLLTIDGEFNNPNGAVLDLASSSGGVIHDKWIFNSNKNSKKITYEFELKKDVDDFEIRMFVANNTKVKIKKVNVLVID